MLRAHSCLSTAARASAPYQDQTYTSNECEFTLLPLAEEKVHDGIASSPHNAPDPCLLTRAGTCPGTWERPREGADFELEHARLTAKERESLE